MNENGTNLQAKRGERKKVRVDELRNRKARKQLLYKKSPYYYYLQPRITLGYMKLPGDEVAKPPYWLVRFSKEKVRKTVQIGAADDFPHIADNEHYFSFEQACERAIDIARSFSPKKSEVLGEKNGATFSDAVDIYLEKRRNSRKGLLRGMEAHCERFRSIFGEKRLVDITSKDLNGFMMQIATTPRWTNRTSWNEEFPPKNTPEHANYMRSRRNTANTYLATIKAILNNARAEGLVDDDTEWRRVKKFPHATSDKIRFLTELELQAFFNVAPWYLSELCKGSLYTGGRVSELAKLRVRDVCLDVGKVTFFETKNHSTHTVPLSRAGVEFFKKLIFSKQSDDFVFRRSDGKLWNGTNHTRLLQRYRKRAGIEHFTFHCFRHTFACMLLKNGGHVKAISQLLNHGNTKITEKYYAVLPDEALARTMNKCLPEF